MSQTVGSVLATALALGLALSGPKCVAAHSAFHHILAPLAVGVPRARDGRLKDDDMPDSGSAVDPIVIVFAVLGIILAGVAGFFITRRLCTFADGREPLQPILEAAPVDDEPRYERSLELTIASGDARSSNASALPTGRRARKHPSQPGRTIGLVSTAADSNDNEDHEEDDEDGDSVAGLSRPMRVSPPLYEGGFPRKPAASPLGGSPSVATEAVAGADTGPAAGPATNAASGAGHG